MRTALAPTQRETGVSIRRHWVLIGLTLVAACALVAVVPFLTGIDGRYVGVHFDIRPVPHRAVVLLDAETHAVVARKVTDESGHFSMRVGPGHYLLADPENPTVPTVSCTVRLFHQEHATLVLLAK